MHFKSLRDAEVRGKRVLLREDLNVPMKDGAIADDTRITAALPTLHWLREHGAKTVILSHLGRPDGKPNPAYSLRPVATRLAELLGTDVRFVDDCVGEAAVTASRALPDGGFALFENVRFHAGEEADDPAFARELAQSGDLYANDAFGTAHRAHASTAGVAALLPAYAGFLMEAELAALARLTDHPVHPFVCAIGGAKVADKVGVFENLLAKVDAFVIGGGMANTFLAAQGINVGRSLRDPDLLPAQKIIALSLSKGVALHLPTDAVVADAFDADDTARTVPLDAGRRRDDPRHRPATPRARTPGCCATRRRSCSTARWACSRKRRTGTARAWWAKRSRKRRSAVRPAWSAAATPRRPRTRSASRTR